jgi:hypothetical protein
LTYGLPEVRSDTLLIIRSLYNKMLSNKNQAIVINDYPDNNAQRERKNRQYDPVFQ